MKWHLFHHKEDDEDIEDDEEDEKIQEVNQNEGVKVNITGDITYVPIEDKTSASQVIGQVTQLELVSPNAISIDNDDNPDTVLINENGGIKNLYMPFYVPTSSYPHQVNTNVLSEVINTNFVDITLDIHPIPNDKARTKLGHMQTIIDSNLQFQQQQGMSFQLRENVLKSNSIDILLDGINQLDNRLYDIALTFLVAGHNAEELKHHVAEFTAIMANNGFAVQKMTAQVKSGLAQTIPFGSQLSTLDYVYRNFDRQALAVLDMAQNASGSFYGGIPIAKNLVNSQNNMEYLNIFSHSTNHNFGIIGTSGSGKSAFNKVKIHREIALMNIHHQAIDLTGEYVPLTRYIHNTHATGRMEEDSVNLEFTTDGAFVINPLDISIAERELNEYNSAPTQDQQTEEIDINNFMNDKHFDKSQIVKRHNRNFLQFVPLEQKVMQFADFIQQIYNVDGDTSMNFEERSALLKATHIAYEEKGININPKSLYENRADYVNGVFQAHRKKDMPTLSDINRILKDKYYKGQERTSPIKRLLAVISPYLKDSSVQLFDGQSYFGEGRSTDLGSYSFVNYDISNLVGSFSNIAYYVILQNIWNGWVTNPKYADIKKVVDVDEILQEIDSDVWAKFAELMSRQSRKYNAGLTWLTQDYDRLNLNNYAKALISNSSFFFFTHILPTRRDVMQKAFHLNDGVMDRLCSDTQKGDGILIKENEKLFVHAWIRPKDMIFVESNVAKRNAMHDNKQGDEDNLEAINQGIAKDRHLSQNDYHSDI